MEHKGALSVRELEALRRAFAALRGLATRGEDGRVRQEFRARAQSLLPVRDGGIGLSDREVDVLAYAATGLRNAEIANALALSPETVKSYLSSARLKLGAINRHEAVAMARRAGVLP